MSKPFSAFYDTLMPELPGCTRAMVDFHLRAVARDFCDRTSAWRGECIPVDSEAATLTYFLILPEANAQLVKMVKLVVDGTLQWQDQQVDPDATSLPRYQPHKPPFTLNADADEFTLIEQPTGEVVFTAAMRPTLSVTSLPDVLYTQHLEAMRVGVLSRLMKMGRKKWTDRDLAVAYEADFNAHMNHAAMQAARGNVRGPLRTTPSGI